MKKFLFSATFVLFATNLTISASASSFLLDDEVLAYQKELSSTVHSLTNHDYYSFYHNKYYGKGSGLGLCNPTTFCSIKNIKTLLSSIQNGNFVLISPTDIPDSGKQLLSDVQSVSQCKDLSFMNTENMRGEGQATTVPWRPTEGFGIYELPIRQRKIFLVRGSEYNLAWPFWGADVSGARLPPIPSKENSLGLDFITEIDAPTCATIKQFQLQSLRTYTDKDYVRRSFSEPIILEGNLYILAVYTDQVPGQPSSYVLELISLDSHNGRPIADLLIPAFFKE